MFHSVSHPDNLHGWSVLTPGKHTLQLSSIALERTTASVVGVAPHFEFFCLRMMVFLVPTFYFWSSRYVLYTTTFGPA